MQLTGTKRLKDGRQMLPAGGYSEPTENQGIMDMETGEIIALSKKDQRIADAKKNRKEIMAKLQAKVDKENAEAAKPKPVDGDVLELTDYRRKGANAYLVPVTVNKGNIVRGSFEGGDTDDYARAGAGKANKRTIRLGNKPDGWYEYQEGEYGSNRVYRGYIQVKSGKIVDEISSERVDRGGAKDAFLAKVAPVKAMPALAGSAKQQSWAESIREKAVRSGKITEDQASKRTDARWWIDNRNNF